MLGDHELEALRDIERRLRWDSPELARLFSTVELASEESPQACTGKNARGGGGVES
jgi:hypothetical protein